MAANDTIGLNIELPIYNADGTAFHNLVLHKSTCDSIVMSLSDKITGDVYYPNNQLSVTMQEYVELDGVKFVLVNPPTVVKEGMVSDNSQLNGMTKYSFVFYHPMYMLNNFPFRDVAVTSDQTKYLSESKKFSWVGYPDDFIAKLNKNLVGTEWIVEKSDRFPSYLDDQLSEVLPFDDNTIGEALKVGYDTWGTPYVIGKVASTEASYASGKRFKVIFGLPSNEIYEDASHQQLNEPFVFQFGQGVGLKNNSRTPRNNKIITRISGCGSESNIPYGYPQIPWYGDSRWDWTEYEGDTINYDADGKVTNTPKTTAYPLYMGILGGAYVKLIKHPFTRTNLMPSIYSQTLFNKVSPYNSDGTANENYNPNTTLIDYYDAIATQEYPYPNPIVASAPSYESHQFDDIKPELGTDIAIVDAWPINDADLQPSSSWDDSIDDDGNYKQGYFKMTLPVLTFDLYACAAITEEMQINMRGGACLGCTFTVQVDWDDYKNNFYDSEGNFAPTGSQRDYTKYPDTTQEQVTIILQKETATFGTLMPNMYQHPVTGDTFVVLGISLPTSYISNAESRLDGEMKSYMLENNVHYFDYPLKFDEAFLRNYTYILQQIKPNSVIRFKYGNDTLQLFVKQLTVKYGEKVLPQYDITLTDNVEVVLNQIGRVADDVEKLSALIAAVRQNYSRSVWAELEKKLSKTQYDTAQGFIRMLKGLQVGNQFVSGLLGEGGVFRKEADGTTYLEADKMYIRMKAIFDTLEVRKYLHSGGNRIASPANCKCVRVEGLDSNGQVTETVANIVRYRCYFRGSDGDDTITNDFVIGDQAYCHITNVSAGSLYQHSYWRLVIGKSSSVNADGEHYIDLSNAASETISGVEYSGYQSGSDAPLAQDDIIQLGNVNDSTRRGAIIEYVSGANAPSYQIYQDLGNIGSASTLADKQTAQYSLNNKNYIGLGYDSSTGRAYMNVHGDFRFGSANDNGSYIKYNAGTGQLDVKAKINALSTIGNQSMPDYINSSALSGAVGAAIGDLQSQIDGEIATWFLEGTPTLLNEPAVDWNTTALKERHLGDLYYDIAPSTQSQTSGFAYRFVKTTEGGVDTYSWQYIDDTAITQALSAAYEALGLAGTKAKVFTTTSGTLPSPPYNINDVWVNASGTWGTGASAVTYDNDILKCITACPSDGTPSISHWAKASKYTDDSAFNGYIDAILNGSQESGDSYVAAAAQRAIIGALGGATVVDGGLLLTSLIAMRKYNGGDKSQLSSYTTWAGISGMYDAQALGGGIAAWYGGGMVDKETLTTEQIAQGWDTLRWAKGVDRFDGSGYRADANITWTKEGALTIKNITTLSDSNNNNILNELATFNSAFTFGTSGQGSTTALYITPNVPFESLYVGTSNANKKEVATQEWVGNNYVSTAFFRQLFRAFKPNATAGQADVEVQPNTIDATISNIKAMVGFWTEQYVSALGQGSDGGGGGASVLYGLNDVTPNATGDGVMGAQDGYVLTYNGTTNHWYAAATAETYVLPQATSAALGGIKIGYATSGKNYAIALDTNGKAYVNVPWTDHYDWGDITNTPTTIAGYGITDAYTKTEVDALARLSNVAYSSDGVLAFTHQDGSTTYADFTHEHSFLELLDRPTTIAGYEISDVYINNGVVYIGDSSITPVTSVAMTVPTGFSISGSPISKTGTLAVSYASGYEGFTTSLKEKIEALFSWFELDSDGNVKTKDYVDNGTTKHRGFWSESFISALGEGNDGGGGGQGDVTWALLASTATGGRTIDISYLTAALNGYATQSWVQSQGYITQAAVDVLEFLNTVTGGSDILTLTTNKGNSTIVDFTHNHEFLELTDRPTTIAGYGIEDAKIVNGVITLGTNTITPLTSHQSVTNNNISVTWDTETTIATIGSTAIKIKIPANPDTNTWRNIFKDGTEQLATGINTKGLNFVGDGKTTITFLAAGTGEGQSGNANFATLKIGSTWRGIQDNLTSSTNTTESLSAKQGYLLANGSARDNTKLPLTGGTLTGNLTINPSSGDKYLQIGDIKLMYDATNNALYVEHTDTNKVASFYAQGAISALGQGIDGGGGGQGDVTWALLADNTDTRQVALSHLTTALSGYSTTSHTHTTTIATDSGTNQLTLAYGTKYKITAGGTSFIFTMPSADDTNTWRSIYVAGTEKIGTGVDTKGLNFAAGSNVSLSFTAAGSGTGQNANYGTITISATDTTYSVATQSANGLMSAADKTKLDGLEYFNVASRSSDGVVILTTNKSNTTILDLTHQHSFLELVDRPTTLDGYGITGGNLTGNLSVAGAFSATSGKINGNTILDSSNSSVSLSGETLTVKINGTSKSLTNTNTTYSANNGVSLSGTTFSNSGVRATTINGNYLRVNTNGTNADLTIPYASSAGAVAWGNVSSKPSNLFCYQGEVSTAYVNDTTYSTLDSGTYYISYSGYTDSLIHFQHGGSSSGLDIKFNYNQSADAPLYYRKCIDSNRFAGTDWVALIDSLNIGSQSVADSDKCDGLHVHSGVNNEANKIVRTDSNGYMQCGWINTTSGGFNGDITGIDRIYCSEDAYIRYLSPSNFISALSLLTTAGGTITTAANSASTSSWALKIVQGTDNGAGQYDSLVISANDVPAIRISDADGTQLGLCGGDYHGTISSTHDLRFFVNGTANSSCYGGMSGTHMMTINGTGVGIGTSSPSYKLHVSGDVYATGGVTCLTSTSSSDIRMKDVVSWNVLPAIEQVADAPVIRFLWKHDRTLGEQVGSVAQYWQKVLPEVVKVGNDKEHTLSLSYGVAALVAAITTARKVVDHEREIAQLKERVNTLEKENRLLKLKIA